MGQRESADTVLSHCVFSAHAEHTTGGVAVVICRSCVPLSSGDRILFVFLSLSPSFSLGWLNAGIATQPLTKTLRRRMLSAVSVACVSATQPPGQRALAAQYIRLRPQIVVVLEATTSRSHERLRIDPWSSQARSGSGARASASPASTPKVLP